MVNTRSLDPRPSAVIAPIVQYLAGVVLGRSARRVLARPVRPVGTLFIPYLCVAVIAGCSGAPLSEPRFDGPAAEARLEGDTDALDRAVAEACAEVAIAVLDAQWVRTGRGTERMYSLITHTDEPGRLTVRIPRVDNPAEAGTLGPVPLTVSAKLGRFGMPKLERTLLAELDEKLEDIGDVPPQGEGEDASPWAQRRAEIKAGN